ncbi:MAG TPA: GNAT family N-acetyltransferase [Puia sp.]|jgi:putative acetyltransferase|nr:GNAT family N-acetyltransferase [Puia sp.]
MDNVAIRTIMPSDNEPLACIVRSSLVEFGVTRPGTVYYDETTDHLYELFQVPRSIYFVALMNQEIVGGGGIFPSAGLPVHTCELVKMYLKATARGFGLGRLLIEKCIQSARNTGYERIYIESMAELKKALGIYEKFGFRYLEGPMGSTGHFGCDIWMLMEL